MPFKFLCLGFLYLWVFCTSVAFLVLCFCCCVDTILLVCLFASSSPSPSSYLCFDMRRFLLFSNFQTSIYLFFFEWFPPFGWPWKLRQAITVLLDSRYYSLGKCTLGEWGWEEGDCILPVNPLSQLILALQLLRLVPLFLVHLADLVYLGHQAHPETWVCLYFTLRHQQRYWKNTCEISHAYWLTRALCQYQDYQISVLIKRSTIKLRLN